MTMPFQEQEVKVLRTFVDTRPTPRHEERRVRSCPPAIASQKPQRKVTLPPKACGWKPSLASPLTRLPFIRVTASPPPMRNRARSASTRAPTFRKPPPEVIANRPWHRKKAEQAARCAERCLKPAPVPADWRPQLPSPSTDSGPGWQTPLGIVLVDDEPWEAPRSRKTSPAPSIEILEEAEDAQSEGSSPTPILTPEPSPRGLYNLLPSPAPALTSSLEEAKRVLRAPQYEPTISFPKELEERQDSVRAPRQHVSLLPTWSPEAAASSASSLPPPPAEQGPAPSVGSMDHYAGQCRPCAFMTKGCVSGWACSFCHLCDPLERLRRKRIRKKAYKLGLEVDETTGMPSPEARVAIMHVEAAQRAIEAARRAISDERANR